jgi:hypothetical protein
MEGTLARDGDHKRDFCSTATLGCAGFAIVERLSSPCVQRTKPHSQEWLCYSITDSRELYLLGGVCVLSTTFS